MMVLFNLLSLLCVPVFSRNLRGLSSPQISAIDNECLAEMDCTFEGQTANCLDRITYVMDHNGMSEDEAFAVVAGDCPKTCGTCVPDRAQCLAAMDCTFEGQTANCQDRVTYVMDNDGKTEDQAFAIVAGDCPETCGTCDDAQTTTTTTTTTTTLDRTQCLAAIECTFEGQTANCQDRVTYVMDHDGKTEDEAFAVVAGDCPDTCGTCDGSQTTSAPVTTEITTPGQCGSEYDGVDIDPSIRPKPIADDSTYTLVWSDEFGSPSDAVPSDINRDVWTVETHPAQQFNGEWQQYVDDGEHIYQSCGALTIKATGIEKDANSTPYKSGDFKSGRINSNIGGGKDGAVFKYGYMEARVSFVNYARGVWPAFWMLGSDIDTVHWPTCGEIDIMENAPNWGPQGGFDGTANTNSAHLHYPGHFGGGAAFPPNGDFVPVAGDNIRPWHTYGIMWTEESMQWYMDGEPMGGALATPQTYKERDFFFVLNMAVGGILGGDQFDLGSYNDPNGQRMLVDYVRVWQKHQ